MNIDELLSRYAAGERDFSNANLTNADLHVQHDPLKNAILTGTEMPDGHVHH